MIDFGCRGCGRFFRVSDENAGRRGKCPDCGAEVVVPSIDTDIEFDEPSVDDGSSLQYELRIFYDAIVLLKHRLGVISAKVYPNGNVFEITFSVDESRSHKAIATQGEQGGLIICAAKIGDALSLSKDQLIAILKDFNLSGGILFHAVVNADNELVAQKIIQKPPSESHELGVVMKYLAHYGDKVERKYFGIDVN